MSYTSYNTLHYTKLYYVICSSFAATLVARNARHRPSDSRETGAAALFVRFLSRTSRMHLRQRTGCTTRGPRTTGHRLFCGSALSTPPCPPLPLLARRREETSRDVSNINNMNNINTIDDTINTINTINHSIHIIINHNDNNVIIIVIIIIIIVTINSKDIIDLTH